MKVLIGEEIRLISHSDLKETNKIISKTMKEKMINQISNKNNRKILPIFHLARSEEEAAQIDQTEVAAITLQPKEQAKQDWVRLMMNS